MMSFSFLLAPLMKASMGLIDLSTTHVIILLSFTCIFIAIIIAAVMFIVGHGKKSGTTPLPTGDQRPCCESSAIANNPTGHPIDAAEKLNELKAMVDKGLITQGDYNAKKADILGRM